MWILAAKAVRGPLNRFLLFLVLIALMTIFVAAATGRGLEMKFDLPLRLEVKLDGSGAVKPDGHSPKSTDVGGPHEVNPPNANQ